MERCKLPKDIMRLLLQKYFDDSTILKCLRVCKFTNACVDSECKTKMQRGLILKRMKDKHDVYNRRKVLERVQSYSNGDINFVKRWMSKPIHFCEICETPMFEQELLTHVCEPVVESSRCDQCGMFQSYHVHSFDKLSQREHQLPCPLREMTCEDVQKFNTNHYHNLSNILAPCSFKGSFQEIWFKHRKRCKAECLQCDCEFPLKYFYDHFALGGIDKLTRRYLLVCKKIR